MRSYRLHIVQMLTELRLFRWLSSGLPHSLLINIMVYFVKRYKAAFYSSFITDIAEVVSHRLLNLEAWIRSQHKPYRFSGGHNGYETGFSPSTYYCTTVPFSYFHLPLMLCSLDTNTMTIKAFIIKDVPIKCDNFQIAVLMNWAECK